MNICFYADDIQIYIAISPELSCFSKLNFVAGVTRDSSFTIKQHMNDILKLSSSCFIQIFC